MTTEDIMDKRDRYMDDLFHTMDFISWNVIQDPLKPHEYKSFLQVKKEVDYLVEDYEKDHGIIKHIPEITVEEVCKNLLDKLPDNKRANKLAKAIRSYLGLSESEIEEPEINTEA